MTFCLGVAGEWCEGLLGEVANQGWGWKARNVWLIGESGIIAAFRDVTSDQSAKSPAGNQKILRGKLNCENKMEAYK